MAVRTAISLVAIVVAGILFYVCVSLSAEVRALEARAAADTQVKDELLRKVRDLEADVERAKATAIRMQSPSVPSGTVKAETRVAKTEVVAPPPLLERRDEVSNSISDKRRAQEKAIVRNQSARAFAMLLPALSLGKEQEDQLVDVLSEWSMMSVEPSDRETWRQQREAKIASIIGQERMPAFRDYEQNIISYLYAGDLATNLEIAGSPLRPEQRSQLVKVMIEERRRSPPPSARSDIVTIDALRAQVDWQVDFETRVLDGLSTTFSTRQERFIRDYIGRRAAERERMFRLKEAQAAAGEKPIISTSPY